ncbi:MAG TPA: PKD domain-containing protein [Saprospiraceae bacterium]|nr:PKD domain-containing protein [Saprospiraceae bacterium]
MKKALLLLLPLFLLTMVTQTVQAQCNAQFTWEQLPGTLQIHFHSTSTSEHDIVSYSWNFGDGHEGDGSAPYHTFPEPGTYLVCLTITDNFGCVDDVCHEVTIAPIQSDCNAEFTWEQIPGTLQIHFNSTSTSEHDIVSYHWNFGDNHEGDGSSPYHTYAEGGTYLVCLIITDNVGCVSDVCHEVTVQGLPPSECNAEFIWEQFSGSLEVDFTNTSTSDHDIVSFHWNFGDGHEGDGPNPTHTYTEPGTYLVCLIIETEDGCVSDVCHEVTVEEPQGDCHAQFTWEQIPGTLQIHFNSTSTSEHDIISITWHFGDGSEGDGDDPYHTYDEPGTYVVCIRIEDNTGCVSELCHEVTVEPLSGDCHAQFTWEQIPGTLQIHFNSTSTSQHDIVSYVWHFGDGTEGDGNDPYHTYDEPGVYVVCLIITDSEGCVSDVCHEVTVGEPEGDCHAEFTWEQIPGSLQIHFFSTSTSENDIISYGWHFGDGHEGDGNDPYHTYDHPGTYVVCLRIEDNTGCVSEICHEVTVEGEQSGCHASFNWEQFQDSLAIHFNSTSTSEHDIISYHWNFGDGSEGDGHNPNHTYDEPGTYLVCLIITDSEGCVSDVCHEVTVQGETSGCHAIFTWEPIQGTNNIHFFNQSTSEHDIISYHWTFGDGHDSNVQNPIHEYAEPGIYVVCLRIEDNTGCVSEICHEVQVGEPQEGCHAQFTWEQIPGTLQIHFNSTSTSEHDIISYHWNFGDGHEGDGHSPYHTYDQPGTYLVCLIITDNTGCVSDVCHEVTVGQPECNATFNFEVENGTVFFNNNSTGGTQHTTWLWEFGDGNTSTEENPQHEYGQSGMYTVCLFMTDTTNGCEDHYCVTLVFELGFEPLHFDEYPQGAQSASNAGASLHPDLKKVRYNNPVDQTIFIEYLMEEKGVVQIEIYNLYGNRLSYDRVDNVLTGAHQHTVDVSQLQPGMYLLSVMVNGERKTMGMTISR